MKKRFKYWFCVKFKLLHPWDIYEDRIECSFCGHTRTLPNFDPIAMSHAWADIQSTKPR